MRTAALTLLFAATIPTANWLIGNVGTECTPNGPCLLPVGFGLTAPSGVLVIGAALVLRDMVHEAGGLKAALFAIALGGVIAWLFAPPALVLASVAAFLLAELADLAVYAPLRSKRLGLAVLASGLVTNAENGRNQSMPRTNTSGVIGVRWSKRDSKWQAKIKIDGRSKHLGYFDTLEAAIAARAEAERNFGFYPGHGKPALAAPSASAQGDEL